MADVEAGRIDDSLPSEKRHPTRLPFKEPRMRMSPTTKRRQYCWDRRRTCLLWKTRRKSHELHQLKWPPLHLRNPPTQFRGMLI